MATKQEMQMAVAAVKAGLLRPDQVQVCMDLQRSYEERGENVPLWKLLVAKGFLTKDQIRELISDKRSVPLPKSVSVALANQIPGFTFHEKIGEGGVASVFRASDPNGAQVAVKVLFPLHSVNELFVQRFKQEAELMIEFTHKHLVKGYSYGACRARIVPEPTPEAPAEGVPATAEADQAAAEPIEFALHYFVMELVDGQSVQDDLGTNGALDEGKALHIILQITDALDYLQAHQCVHRDIKPDNILYDTATGDIKLCDLGFAKAIEEGKEGQLDETTCGTVQYISPEQARGLADVDIRADIYSLGATLYHLVVGEVPFEGRDSMDVMAKQVLESLESDKYRKRGLSPYIGYFIEKMMAKERDVRYQTPAEITEDITSILATQQEFDYDPAQDPEVMRGIFPHTTATTSAGDDSGVRAGIRGGNGRGRHTRRTTSRSSTSRLPSVGSSRLAASRPAGTQPGKNEANGKNGAYSTGKVGRFAEGAVGGNGHRTATPAPPPPPGSPAAAAGEHPAGAPSYDANVRPGRTPSAVAARPSMAQSQRLRRSSRISKVTRRVKKGDTPPPKAPPPDGGQ